MLLYIYDFTSLLISLLRSIWYRDPCLLPYLQRGMIFTKKCHLYAKRSEPLKVRSTKVRARRYQCTHNFTMTLPRGLTTSIRFPLQNAR